MSTSGAASHSRYLVANILRRIMSEANLHGQSVTAIRHLTLKGDRKMVLPAKHQHRSQKAFPYVPIPTRRAMTGEWQASSPALVEPRVSTKHILSQLRSRSSGQPGNILVRYQPNR